MKLRRQSKQARPMKHVGKVRHSTDALYVTERARYKYDVKYRVKHTMTASTFAGGFYDWM